MAINTPLSDAKLQEYDYTPHQAMAQEAASGNAFNQGLQNALSRGGDQANAKLKALLQGESEKQTLANNQATLEDLKSKNPNAKVDVGNISVGVDPAVAIQKKQMQTTSAEANKLNSVYGKDSKDLEGAAEQVETGLTGLAAGTPQGDSTANAAITRLADGKGARLSYGQLTHMTPDSAHGSIEKMLNYLSSTAESGWSPSQRSAAQKLLMDHSTRLQQEYGDAINEVKTQAPYLAPTLAASGQLDPYIKSFGQKGQATFDRINKLSGSMTPTPPTPTGQPAAQPQGLLDRARSGISSLADLIGGAGSRSSTATPQSTQSTQPGFDPDAYLGVK